MSRIFDALQGSRNEVSDLLPALIGEVPKEPLAQADAEPSPSMEESAEEAEAAEAPPLAAEAPAPYARTPVSAAIPSVRVVEFTIPTSEPLLPFENAANAAAEQYRIARTKIAHHPRRPKVIVISSASPGDGKTVTAINLAGVLALKSESKVLLLDADFRRSTTHLRLGLPETPGLAEVIMGKCSFEDAAVQASQFPNLHVLVAGEMGGMNPGELLDSSRWPALCQMMRARYQYIIVDSPPVAAVADFDLIQASSDGTILVVRPDHTKRAACFKALDTVPKEKLIGVLLNCEQDWFLSRHTSYGYYGYAYESPAKRNGDAGSEK